MNGIRIPDGWQALALRGIPHHADGTVRLRVNGQPITFRQAWILYELEEERIQIWWVDEADEVRGGDAYKAPYTAETPSPPLPDSPYWINYSTSRGVYLYDFPHVVMRDPTSVLEGAPA